MDCKQILSGTKGKFSSLVLSHVAAIKELSLDTSKSIEIIADVIRSTERALLLKNHNEETTWVPKSLCSLSQFPDCDLAMPELHIKFWFARKENLLGFFTPDKY